MRIKIGTIKKITTGFVIQDYDSETGTCVAQEFIAGDVVYEDRDGNSVEAPNNEQYQTFEMLQPGDENLKKILSKLKAACVSVVRAHVSMETCDMPSWLDEVEAALRTK